MRDSTASYRLYGTGACHLCDLAEALLIRLAEEEVAFAFHKVDISESDQLFERYGIRIPVLRRPDGAELDWPFSAGELRLFTKRRSPTDS